MLNKVQFQAHSVEFKVEEGQDEDDDGHAGLVVDVDDEVGHRATVLHLQFTL